MKFRDNKVIKGRIDRLIREQKSVHKKSTLNECFFIFVFLPALSEAEESLRPVVSKAEPLSEVN